MNRKQRRTMKALERGTKHQEALRMAKRIKLSEAFRNGDLEGLTKLGIKASQVTEALAMIDRDGEDGMPPGSVAFLRRAESALKLADAHGFGAEVEA